MIHARGLYAIVDPEHCRGRDADAVAAEILVGGCAVLQLRAKRLGSRDFLALARSLRARTRRAKVAFVVNDRPDLAVLAEADGVHLGQDDLAVAEARRVVGPMAIGVSTHALVQARRALEEGADLIGVGPVFATVSKENPDPLVGLEGLALVARSVPLPIVAIGGITPLRVPESVRAGAQLVAAIGALCGADEPRDVALAMHRAALEGTS